MGDSFDPWGMRLLRRLTALTRRAIAPQASGEVGELDWHASLRD